MNLFRCLLCCFCLSLLAACGGGGSTAPSVTVTITPPKASVMVAEQIQLTAATTNAMSPPTWSSSDTSVATVDSTGLVRAINLGKVTITATSGEASATAALSITAGIEFSSISAGSNHTCGVGGITGAAVFDVAYCWGDNSFGQLGNGTTANSDTPVPVSGGMSFSIVSAGGNQTCGVTTDGVTYCWGDNSFGQLGNGTTTSSTTPRLVAGGHVFARVSVGGRHVCAEPGPACWGDNSSGQLGNGTTTDSSVPVAVAPGYLSQGPYYSLDRVSAGSDHTCGLAQGNVGFITYSATVCWGDNRFGQLGNGTTTNSAVPMVLSVDPGFTFFSAGTLFTCADNPDTGPSGYCWGKNGAGQLGNGTTTDSTTPVDVLGKRNFTSMASGGMHACAVVNESAGPFTYCWGDNGAGQLGDGTATSSATPVAVVGGLIFRSLTAGSRHTCGISTSNGTYCWGDNTFGQLGNSWTTKSAVPVNIAGGQ